MSKKILIIDDEELIVLMLKRRFLQHGFNVVTAHDGQEGLALAKKEVPDIIILDEMMPKMDGYKVAGLLKSDTRFNKIPIIMFSAKAEEDETPLSKEVGINLYLSKMIDFSALLEHVKNLTGKSS